MSTGNHHQSPCDEARQSPRRDAGAADVLEPKEVLELQEQGRAAATAGEPVTVCPWRAAEGLDRARRDMWVRGYAVGRTDLRAARAGGPTGAAALPPLPGGIPCPPSAEAEEGRV